MFVSIRRYRCGSWSCAWEGRRVTVKSKAGPADADAVQRVSRTTGTAMNAESEIARVTLDALAEAVLSTDLLANVSYLNRAAEAMTGWSRADALGRPLEEVFRIADAVTREADASPALRTIAHDRSVELAGDCVLVSRDGRETAIEHSVAPIPDQDGRSVGAVITFRDVSLARTMALKMTHLAQHDPLTGLPNRLLLTERLSQAIGQARRHGKQLALLFLDLDHFKHINDSLGHATGDRLLASVANRLKESVRATDTVFRQGGDEFVILLTEISQPQDATLVADKLLAACAQPQLIDAHELRVTSSIGISIYPDDGHDVESVMSNADAAMYQAKQAGGNNCSFFRADMNCRAVRHLFFERSRASGATRR
jgi:diguanylate cyclase (GGDEF)-like protein/PAS domain S-box-containing protein